MHIMHRCFSFLGTAVLAASLAAGAGCAEAAPADAFGSTQFTELAQQGGPAVVNINTEKTVKSRYGSDDIFGEMFRGLPPGFEQFFGPFQQKGRKGKGKRSQPKQKSLGSGFIISADGYIVTNNHVVEGADVIRVTLDDKNGKGGEPVKAKLVGADSETDLALLKIEVKQDLPFLKFGDSDSLKVGEWVMAIGNPFGLDHSVTAGILSAKGRNINAGAFDNFLQTDASINPGNSGGPLINMQGEVIGINTAIIASGQGIGFAIPSNMAKDIISQIKDSKKVSRGWMGVTIQDLDEHAGKALGLPSNKGALIADVQPGQPAEQAGIQEGDVVTKIDGKAIEDRDDLLRTVAGKRPGTEIKVEVYREGEYKTFSVKLGDRQSNLEGTNDKSGISKDKDKGSIQLGMTVRPLTSEELSQLDGDIKGGLLIIDVDDDKPAAEAGLAPGDVILKANMKPVRTLSDLSKIVNGEGAKRGAVVLQVYRSGAVFFRSIELEKKDK